MGSTLRLPRAMPMNAFLLLLPTVYSFYWKQNPFTNIIIHDAKYEVIYYIYGGLFFVDGVK